MSDKKDEAPKPPKTRTIDIPLTNKQAEHLATQQSIINEGKVRFQTALESILAGTDQSWDGEAQLVGVVDGKSFLGGKKKVLRITVTSTK